MGCTLSRGVHGGKMGEAEVMVRQKLTEGQPSLQYRQERKGKSIFCPPVATNPASDCDSHHPSVSTHGSLPQERKALAL